MCRGRWLGRRGGGKVDDDARPLAAFGQQGELTADVGGMAGLDDQAAAAGVTFDLDGADDALGLGPVVRFGHGGTRDRDDDLVLAGKGEFVGNGCLGFQHQAGEILVQTGANLKARRRIRRMGGQRDKPPNKARGE